MYRRKPYDILYKWTFLTRVKRHSLPAICKVQNNSIHLNSQKFRNESTELITISRQYNTFSSIKISTPPYIFRVSHNRSHGGKDKAKQDAKEEHEKNAAKEKSKEDEKVKPSDKGEQSETPEKKQAAEKDGDKPEKEVKRALLGAKHIFDHHTERYIREKKIRFRVVGIILVIGIIFFVSNLHVSPLTNRKKFHIFNEKQALAVGQLRRDHYIQKYQNQIETSGPDHERITKVLNKLIERNPDLPWKTVGRTWTVHLIRNPEVVNTYVMVTGDVFITSGLLDMPDLNDDHIAALLAHLASHVLLTHEFESSTVKRLIVAMILRLMVDLYMYFPSALGNLIYPVVSRASVVTMKYTHMGKILEQEADNLSLTLVSKACFDSRKVKQFWQMVDAMGSKKASMLKSHPTNVQRFYQLDSLQPKAFMILHRSCMGNEHPFFRDIKLSE